jgi:hypothetical protein
MQSSFVDGDAIIASGLSILPFCVCLSGRIRRFKQADRACRDCTECPGFS